MKQTLNSPPRRVDSGCEPANCHGQIKTYSIWQKVHILKIVWILIRSGTCLRVYQHINKTRRAWRAEAVKVDESRRSDATRRGWAERQSIAESSAADRLMLFWTDHPPICFKLLTQGVGETCLRNEVKKLDVWKYLFRLAWQQPQVWRISKVAKVQNVVEREMSINP